MSNSTESYFEEIDCIDGVPSAGYFWRNINGIKTLSIVIFPSVMCLLIWIVYYFNLKNVANAPLTVRSNIFALVSIYPIVSVFSLTAILLPRSYFFNDSAGHIAFMIISWQLYRLCMIYVDGESNFISIAGDDGFSFKSPPLCCCLPFKGSKVTKSKFKLIKFLVLQMPFCHIAIFLILNIIYIEDIQTFDNVILYFIPFIAITVLGGIFGYNLAVRTLSPQYRDLKLLQKYFVFQLVLFFCKILPILLNAIMKQLIKTCDGPFSIVVKRHTIIQQLVQVEMFILSLWALRLYKDPLPFKK